MTTLFTVPPKRWHYQVVRVQGQLHLVPTLDLVETLCGISGGPWPNAFPDRATAHATIPKIERLCDKCVGVFTALIQLDRPSRPVH